MVDVLEQHDFGCYKDSVKALCEAILQKPIPVRGNDVVFNKLACVVPLDGNGDAGVQMVILTERGTALAMTGERVTKVSPQKKAIRPATDKEIDVWLEECSERSIQEFLGFVFDLQALL